LPDDSQNGDKKICVGNSLSQITAYFDRANGTGGSFKPRKATAAPNREVDMFRDRK
jgi:hypothetical protein